MPAFIARMSVQVVPLRTWRTTTRPDIGLPARRPVPALFSVAVKVTMAPATTEVSEAASVVVVPMSRHVL